MNESQRPATKLDIKISKSDIKIGSIFHTVKGYNYEVIAYAGKNEQNRDTFTIKFEDTGFITTVYYGLMMNGNIKDPYHLDIYGVACLGQAPCRINNIMLREYSVWRNMIQRCYYPISSGYNLYGEKGVSVCKRWMCYENFYNDIQYIPGYNKYLFDNSLIFLDKDIIQWNMSIDQIIYSPDTCMFVSAAVNYFYRSVNNNMYGISVIDSTTGEMSDFEYMKELCKSLHMKYETLVKCLQNPTTVYRNHAFAIKPYFVIPQYIQEARRNYEVKTANHPLYDENGLRIVYKRINQ